MAKAFTKLGREIVIAVKAGGPHPESNPRLRMIIQNAKAINMPKVNVESICFLYGKNFRRFS